MTGRQNNGLFEPRQLGNDLRHLTLASFVDMARWMAAAAVMFAHLRSPLLLGYNDLSAEQRPMWVKLWYFLTGMHSEAVIVFFVLSGFLVGGLAAARMSEGRFDPNSYAIDRISRLFIAYFPALLLTGAVDLIGIQWFSSSGLWDGQQLMMAQKDPGKIFENNLGWTAVLGNVLMVQSYLVVPLGSNGPLWTLSSEFWFYAVFGLLMTAALRPRYRVLLVVLAVAACGMLGLQFVGFFGLWLIGFGVACIAPRRVGHPLIPLVMLLAYLGTLRAFSAVIDADSSRLLLSHYGLALIFAWLLLSMRSRRVAGIETLGRLNKFMADFSYSLYLIHFPLLLLAIAVLGRITGDPGYFKGFAPTSVGGLLSYVAIAVFLLVAAWLFAQFTEARTARLRSWLKNRLDLGAELPVEEAGRAARR